MTVEGRTNDVLTFEIHAGEQVTVLPLAIETVVEATPGVHRFQLIQTGPRALTVRLEPTPGTPPAEVRAVVGSALASFLATIGAGGVEIRHDLGPPQQQPRSGKLRHVFRAV